MINNKFIQIHIPRTGGQQIRGIIYEKQGSFDLLVKGSHMTLEESLKELSKRRPGLVVPSFCFIRNPWDWYVSRYFFRRKEAAGKLGPHTKVETLSNDKKGFQEHLRILDKHIQDGKLLSPIRKRNVPRIWRNLEISKFYENMTRPGVDYICRFENFSKEVSRILVKLHPAVFKNVDILRKTKQKYNASQHTNYINYYDNELKEMVGRWDKDFINQFKYKFGP